MIPHRVRLASLAAFLLHGVFILTARYHLSYDAYVHMFFGDHYRTQWWSLWDPRWYAGFFVSSYPPLVHQLIGLMSHVTGVDAAFALILWLTVTVFPLSIYAFSLIFVRRPWAEAAALAGAVLPSIYLSAHIFGQLPFLFATMIALFGSAALAAWLRSGNRLDGFLSVALMAVVMASHHAVLLLLPLLFFCVSLHLFLTAQVKWKPLLMRLGGFAVASCAAMLLVVWPFWDWGRSQAMQVPIDHLSRHNFFESWQAPVVFFLPMYGPLMLVIPLALMLGMRRRNISLALLFIPLFLLGLGGTTPLPRWLFGSRWEWLTYDRFAVWASVALLPMLPAALGYLRRFMKRGAGRSHSFNALLVSMAVFSCLVAGFSSVFPIQPGAVDMRQVVNFLAQDDHSNWRYLTFGFGDQLALLSILAPTTTIDGSYHTARELPELRASGIAQIDTAYWSAKGLDALDPILRDSGRYGVRWGFVNVPQYVPVLERNGWLRLKVLKGGIQVWENPGAVTGGQAAPPPVSPLASFSWGVLPLLALVTASALASVRLLPAQSARILPALHALLLGLVPPALSFWYYRSAGDFSHTRVYFSYDHALFFLADVPVLVAVLLWLVHRVSAYERLALRPMHWLLLALCGWASLSVLWSLDWRTSLYLALHLWLVCGLVFSMSEWPRAWLPVMLGFCAALGIQAFATVFEVATQSTAALAPLRMTWPGLLTPSVRAASVVALADGSAFLRAYGTLPHPNILGGFAVVALSGPLWLYLRPQRPNWLAPVLLSFGIAVIGLTFSRSGWLACLALALVLGWKSKHLARRRLVILAAVAALTLALTLLPLRSLVMERTLAASSHAEQFSGIARAWLSGQALNMITSHSAGGLGIGSFVIHLGRTAGPGFIVEPVHNLLLLAGAELGLPGMLLLAAIAIQVGRGLRSTPRPESILAGACLAGLGVIALLDHYLWTLAPGRLLLGTALGLWLGQEARLDA